ncbi:MAG: OpgC family protein [Geminicoccaceae bacterium]
MQPVRDVKVDFFRGIAMFIIFISHVPGNYWTLHIPARFGPSDATEMFVFCSGFASAIAFGGSFERNGFFAGCLRVVQRVWQIYWAHICLFLIIAALTVFATDYLDTRDYVKQLNLVRFFEEPGEGLVHLLTLTYVPNYFDILPMYMGVLALLPIIILCTRIHVYVAMIFSVSLYAAAWHYQLQFPAEWWSNREWFFNPLGWQLLFFTGFLFGAGLVRAPEPNKWLILACIVFVLALIPLKHWALWKSHPLFTELSYFFWPSFAKTDFGIARWLHFMALAYLAVCLLRGREHWLAVPVLAPIIKVGQQALPVFLTSMVLSRIGGMVFDVYGKSAAVHLWMHAAGFLALIATAYIASVFKAQPWRKKPAAPAPARALPAQKPRQPAVRQGGTIGVAAPAYAHAPER